uniref:hypothetical protein n=1 Tax=Prevotella sp. TaxID=59823 RepID=UPI003FEDD2DF
MNRNKMILGAWVLGLLFPIEMMAKTSCTDNSTLLWYNAPAQQWLEALPIGNSHQGLSRINISAPTRRTPS